MNISRLSTLSLSLAIAVMTLAYASPSSAAKPGACDSNPPHPSCKPDDGNGSSALFTVAVFFGGSGEPSGIAENVEPGGNETRPNLKGTDMGLDLAPMGTAIPLLPSCNTIFGFHAGQFAVSTARIPKSSEFFTYVAASFWNFEASDASGDVSIYFVIFGPGDDGVINDEANWLPAGNTGDSNFLTGEKLRLDVQTGPAKKGPCDGLEILLPWKIVVTKE